MRQKAIRDHNSQLKSAEKRGIELGTQSTLKRLVKANVESGKSLEEIAEFLGLDLSEVEKMSKE